MNFMMVIPTQEEFDAFFEKVIVWSMDERCNRVNAVSLLRKNLSYWSGYARIERYLK